MKKSRVMKAGGAAAPSAHNKTFGVRLKTDFSRNYALYIMILPVVVFFIVFSYFPMVGLIAAFKDYKTTQGIFGSPWATNLEGVTDIFYHFKTFFADPYFGRLIRNTLIFSLLDILIVFPAPVILALLMNYIQVKPYRRVAQTMVYMPYFISMVVVCGLVRDFTSESGLFGVMFQKLGLVSENTGILGDTRFFRGIVIVSNVWQSTGYGSIVYIAALCAIDKTFYEAADIDGAGKAAKLFRITLPSIMSTIMIFLLLKIAGILNYNFEKIYLLYSIPTYEVGDILSTYVYRIGIEQGRLSYTTAISLFISVVGFVLLIIANAIVKRFSENSPRRHCCSAVFSTRRNLRTRR